ncbi:hypothetical protein [Desulfatirhabdium butyrativorans]|uniref:hypothetical protein n=1 Tax=Desulfatirhabdium butyrativorans TaxID=340467 RepID=UPI0004163988|nr:hypothetical protein [Desulfatirhabdium butyrativorans]
MDHDLDHPSQDLINARKQAVLNGMSDRRRKHILRKGIENWDPFQEPKDPIDIRKDPTRRTTQQLVREFLQQRDAESYSNAYGAGVLEMALGLINHDDRCQGMYDFACWYQKLCAKEIPSSR